MFRFIKNRRCFSLFSLHQKSTLSNLPQDRGSLLYVRQVPREEIKKIISSYSEAESRKNYPVSKESITDTRFFKEVNGEELNKTLKEARATREKFSIY